MQKRWGLRPHQFQPPGCIKVPELIYIAQGLSLIHIFFRADAEVWTKDYNDPSILWIVRRYGDEELHAVFNFSDYPKTVWMPEKAEYTNLLSGGTDEIVTMDMPGWGFLWMKKKGQLL